MDRMLAKKSHHKEISDDLREGCLMSLIKGLCKSLIEEIRKIRFDKFGFQQLQIDLYMLVQIIYEMVSTDDESIIFGFYFEMIECAKAKCSDPAFKELQIIESIANIKRAKLKI